MRAFLRQVKRQWQPLARPNELHSYRVRWALKSIILRINEELVVFLRLVEGRPSFTLFLIAITVTSYFLPNWLNDGELTNYLVTITGSIVSFISILFAAAIFVSTLTIQSNTKISDEERKFMGVLVEHKETLKDVYSLFEKDMSIIQKVDFLRAVAAIGVQDQTSYEEYKRWHHKVVVSVDFELLGPSDSYNRIAQYPYDTMMQAVQSRPYAIETGVALAQGLIDGSSKPHARLRQSLLKLSAAIKMYANSGAGGFYARRSLIGTRLVRIVFYCLIGVGLLGLLFVGRHYSADLIPWLNVEAYVWIQRAASGMSFFVIYLIIRYVFGFISYLSSTGGYRRSLVYDAVAIVYEQDLRQRSPTATYYHGSRLG